MPRRKIPGRILVILALLALILVVAMDLLAPGSYIRAALDPDSPFLSPHQRLEHLFDRAMGQEPPVNPFR